MHVRRLTEFQHVHRIPQALRPVFDYRQTVGMLDSWLNDDRLTFEGG